jgi:hypothetical protein
MDASPNTTPSGPNWRWRLLMWSAITIAFTSWSIQFSYHHGRLIGAPGCDDVGYFNDGLDRLEVFYLRGWKGLAHSYSTSPPHSPFSTTLAAASFGLFGIHEWAPYAGNGLIVFLLVVFTDLLLLGARLWVRLAGLALVLTLPLTHKAVDEFRPDVAVALLTAMGVVMVLMRSLVTSSRRYQCVVGLVFGLALLVKPTMCVLTIFLWGLSLSVALLCDRYLEKPGYRRLLTTYSLTGLITCIVAAPYYLWNGKHIFHYIYTNIFGSEAATWQIQISLQDHLLYYVTGRGAVEMVDTSVWVLGAAILTGAVYVLARRQSESIVRMSALAFCMLGAYAVPTVSACKHPFYGLAFLSLAVFAALLSLREIYGKNLPIRPIWRVATALILLGGVALTVGQYPTVANWGTYGDSRISSSRKTCGDIVAAIAAQQKEAGAVVLTNVEARYPTSLTLNWIARANGHPFTVRSEPMGSDLETYRQAMKRADFVLAMKVDDPYKAFATERLAAEILAAARSLPNLVEVQSFPSYDGVEYFLFKNTRTSFMGLKNTKNLGPVEGPYPQWELPRVRWGFGNETQVWFDGKPGVPMRLSLSGRAGVVNQTVTVLLDGKEIHSQPLPVQRAFTSIDVPLPITTAGAHEVTLRYGATASAASEARSMSVLFERLQIVPDAK